MTTVTASRHYNDTMSFGGMGGRTLTDHIQICFKGEKKAIGNYWVAELLLKPVGEIGQLVPREIAGRG